jgi:HTH-type transcriptional regulator, transcriptional repressor of NAD biosynthesis genes
MLDDGLVVGKFCPLHLGHELVIRRALEDCRRVAVISYTKPEFPRCAPAVRERWLNARCPAASVLVVDDERLAQWRGGGKGPALPPNDAPGAVHHAFIAWLCTNRLGRMVDAVFSSERYGDEFAADLSRHFSRHAGRVHAVRHVMVDEARRAVPISATRIREQPEQHRDFLAPEVRADFLLQSEGI